MATESNKALMERVCSLGNNCEVGIAQRVCGAEPEDLLRWSITQPNMLVNMLIRRFEGIADLDKIVVEPATNGSFWPVHVDYRHGWHAWTRDLTKTADDIRLREHMRLPERAARLMDDLRANERIFVIKNTQFPNHVLEHLRKAFSLYGNPLVLLVTDGADVQVREDGDFLFGSIPCFADNGNVPATTDVKSWLELFRLVDERHPSRT